MHLDRLAPYIKRKFESCYEKSELKKKKYRIFFYYNVKLFYVTACSDFF